MGLFLQFIISILKRENQQEFRLFLFFFFSSFSIYPEKEFKNKKKASKCPDKQSERITLEQHLVKKVGNQIF